MNRKNSFVLLIIILVLVLLNPGQTSFAAASNPPQPITPTRRPFKPIRNSIRRGDRLQTNATTNMAEPLSCRPLGAVITGTVTTQDTGQPLPFTYVEADYYGNYGDSAFADEQGQYVLKNLSPGPHQIYFETRDARYASEWYNDHTLGSAATIINVTVGVTTTNINAALDRGGFISGIVTAADTGKPVAGAVVEVSDTDGHTVLYASTDNSGHYTTDALHIGNYRVQFQADDYLTAYYNNQSNPNSATPVSVTNLSNTDDINAALTCSGRILGRVTASDTGQGLAGIDIDVQAANGYHLIYTSTDATGNYTVTGLATGSYQLQTALFSEDVFTPYIVGQWYKDKTSQTAADVVAVTAPNDTANINFSLKRGGQITGRVTMADTGNNLPDTHVFVAVYDLAGRLLDGANTQESGFYTTTGFPTGSYKVKFEPNPFDASAPYTGEWYNKKSSADDSDLVNVTAPATTKNINAVLALGAQICGRITAADTGIGLYDTYVNVYDLAGKFVTSPDADPYGYYITTGLHTGNYQLYTIPFPNRNASAYLSEWYNDKPNRATANPVSVTTPYLTPNIDFALTGGTNVTPAAGGTVTNADGIKLTFPAGAVTQDSRVTLEALAGTTQPLSDGQRVLYSFRGTATTLAGQSITQFAKPYTLQVPYTDAQLAAIGLTDPAKLNVGFWSVNIWTPLLPCAGCSINPTNKLITVVVDHFTDFALVGPVAPSNNSLHIFLPFVQR